MLAFSKVTTIPIQELPIMELYMPPLNVRLLDHRTFGLKPLVGTHTIQSLKEYRRDPVAYVEVMRQKFLRDGKKI